MSGAVVCVHEDAVPAAPHRSRVGWATHNR